MPSQKNLIEVLMRTRILKDVKQFAAIKSINYKLVDYVRLHFSNFPPETSTIFSGTGLSLKIYVLNVVTG